MGTTLLIIAISLIAGIVFGKLFFSKPVTGTSINQEKTSPNWEDLKASLNAEYESKIANLKLEHEKTLIENAQKSKDAEKSHREDAIKRSKAVLGGKAFEHIFPFMSDFEYNPEDARFVGAPVDFIVFDGASEGNIKQVIFYEIKTGKSRLNKQELNLKKAIEDRNVLWKTIQVANPVMETEIPTVTG